MRSLHRHTTRQSKSDRTLWFYAIALSPTKKLSRLCICLRLPCLLIGCLVKSGQSEQTGVELLGSYDYLYRDYEFYIATCQIPECFGVTHLWNDFDHNRNRLYL